MVSRRLESLPLYPEGRLCRRPTTRKLIDLFEPIQRHSRFTARGQEEIYITELSPLQRKVLQLLRIPTTGFEV
jgi:hypothetical protein